MCKKTNSISIILSIVFIFIACIFLKTSYPYFKNNKHTPIPPLIRSTSFQNESGLPLDVYVKFKSEDGFIAGNPVDVEIYTSQTKKIQSVQVTLIGASKYFLPDYDFDNNFTEENIKKSKEDALSNLILLEKKIEHNEEILPDGSKMEAIYSYHSPVKQFIYPAGGNFGIGITINIDGKTIGYEIGHNPAYESETMITISPPETLIGLKTNNLVIALALVTIGIAFLILDYKG